jgi:hypothetical protein
MISNIDIKENPAKRPKIKFALNHFFGFPSAISPKIPPMNEKNCTLVVLTLRRKIETCDSLNIIFNDDVCLSSSLGIKLLNSIWDQRLKQNRLGWKVILGPKFGFNMYNLYLNIFHASNFIPTVTVQNFQVNRYATKWGCKFWWGKTRFAFKTQSQLSNAQSYENVSKIRDF